jgi:hypothetical protein
MARGLPMVQSSQRFPKHECISLNNVHYMELPAGSLRQDEGGKVTESNM